MTNTKIIIIGGGNHHNALGVIRSLGKRNYDFDLITYGSLSSHYITSSKFVSNHIEFEQPEEVIQHLNSLNSCQTKIILISCSDSITELLSIHYDELAEKFIIPGINKAGLMKKNQDKYQMIETASKFGLSTPQTWTIPEEAHNITFPCITKSVLSSHGGKQCIVILNDKKELDDFRKQHNEQFFVQQYIDKKEEVQFIGCSLNEGEDIIIPGMTKIIRSQSSTNTGFLEYGEIEEFWLDTVAKSKEYLKECKYSGLFSIEFIRDYDDNVYFLETNFRNDGNAYCVTAAGVNLPVIWVNWCAGISYRDEIKPVKNIFVMPEFQDCKLVLEGKLSPFIWLKDLLRTDCFLEWDKYDKKPFFKAFIDKIENAFK
ncbi:MAG: ATP-grasp domain-containing protein [Bacilli bacterium]|nr:ATP-grasp domain-containing protein [Bacilli bacterium]